MLHDWKRVPNDTIAEMVSCRRCGLLERADERPVEGCEPRVQNKALRRHLQVENVLSILDDIAKSAK